MGLEVHVPRDQAAPAIEVRKVCKSFGAEPVLAHVDVIVRRGETTVLLGPSGSGKSTLCRIMVGLEMPDSGQLWLHGQPWLVRDDPRHPPRVHRNYRAMRLRLGMVFQEYTLFPQMTVRENVALAPRKVLRLPRADVEARTEEVLRRVGLWEKADSYPAHLSGGQKQRAAIARELAMRREILFLDEATSALDPELIGEVLDVVRELAADGMTMVIVTHEMHFASQVATRVVFMDRGLIIEAGTAKSFFESPTDPRAKQFLGRVGGHETSGS